MGTYFVFVKKDIIIIKPHYRSEGCRQVSGCVLGGCMALSEALSKNWTGTPLKLYPNREFLALVVVVFWLFLTFSGFILPV